MFATEKAAISGKGRWVWRGENEVFLAVDACAFFLRGCAPEHKNNVFAMLVELFDDLMGKGFPAVLGVRIGLMCANG